MKNVLPLYQRWTIHKKVDTVKINSSITIFVFGIFLEIVEQIIAVKFLFNILRNTPYGCDTTNYIRTEISRMEKGHIR